MTAPAKFLFNVDFAGARANEALHTLTRAAFDAALAEAEKRGHRAGLAAAGAAALADRTTLALTRIADGIDALARNLRAVEGRLEAEAVEVAVAVAAKLAPELIAREPFAEVSALAAECFRHLVGAPHVVVRVSDALYVEARERLEEIARVSAFEGRLVVLAEPEIAPGDCRIEWADGGLARTRAQTEAVITEAVERYVAVRRAPQS